MFYSGLVRKKNVLGVMMQCVFLMCMMTVIWALWGYYIRIRWRTQAPPMDRQFRPLLHEQCGSGAGTRQPVNR